MFTMTELGGTHLAEMLAEIKTEDDDDRVIRFLLEGSDLSLMLDTERPDDIVLKHDGQAVLVLDQDVSDVLADATLDVNETDEGPELVIS